MGILCVRCIIRMFFGQGLLLVMFLVVFPVSAWAEDQLAEQYAEQFAEQYADQIATQPVDQPAAQPKQAPPAEDPKEMEKDQDGLPVRIEHEGTDPVGLRLAFHLKETFQRSGLFRLAGVEERHFSLRLVTKEQFKDRPHLGSIYVVVWRYVESRDVLAYSLGERLGFADADVVAQEAEVIAAETDRVRGRYGYLLH